jgi:uncharacterized protein
MKNLNRRRFLKSGIVSAAGMVVLSTEMVYGTQSEQEKKIIYRTLGKTGIKVPVIGMGVMTANNPSLVKAALDKGINFFDTANGYQNGRNEEMLGEVFKDYPRNSFVIATKVKPIGVDQATGKPTNATTAEDFLAKFDTSLKRLKMDYVDMLLMHTISTPEMVSFKPIVKAMQQLKKEGKTKYIGISTHVLPDIIDTMLDAGIWDVVFITYNFLHKVRAGDPFPPVKDIEIALKKANDAGLGVVAMKTLAGGGFLDKERTKPMNTTAAIKWVLSNPYIHAAVPGMTNFDQLDLNVKILEDITLNDQEIKDINIARAEKGLYCSTCNNCLAGCKFNLPIPDLMRAYMYAYGYANSGLAYNLLTDLSAGDNPCKACEICSATCTKNFNIKEKITDISRLVNVPSDFITG